jgi:hypothetical protein
MPYRPTAAERLTFRRAYADLFARAISDGAHDALVEQPQAFVIRSTGAALAHA